MKIAIVGGACCGKTSLIKEFEGRGYKVMHEKAREVLKELAGESVLRLQTEMAVRQIRDEESWNENELVFLDRGVIDTLVYSKYFDVNLDVLKNTNLFRRYHKVFVLDRIPFEKDDLRVEKDEEEVNKIHNLLINEYIFYGHSPIFVPLMPVPERVDFILSHLKNNETEVKIKIDKDKMNNMISLLGEKEFKEQRNIVYKLPTGYLRVRLEKDKAILTYKGERKGDKLNSREEIEISSQPRILEIINNLEFNMVSFYFKKRANYSLNDCVVSFDIIEDDYYVEIEGDEKNINEVLKELELNNFEIEKRAYWEIYPVFKNN